MKTAALSFLISLFFFVSPCAAQQGAPADPTAAKRALAKSSQFAIGLLGEGGDVGDDQKALTVLLSAPFPESHLESLLKESSAVAKLYGLCGLKAIASPRYPVELATFRTSDAARETISTQSGCETWTEPAAESLKRLELDCAPKNFKR